MVLLLEIWGRHTNFSKSLEFINCDLILCFDGGGEEADLGQKVSINVSASIMEV